MESSEKNGAGGSGTAVRVHGSIGFAPAAWVGAANVRTTELMPQLSEMTGNELATERLPSLSTTITVAE